MSVTSRKVDRTGEGRNNCGPRWFSEYMRSPVHLRAALAAVLLALTAPAVASAASTSAAPAPVPLAASLTQCFPAKDSTGGSAVFKGSMPLVSGAVRMHMQFELQQSVVAGSRYVKVAVPGWEAWQQSEAGRSGFVYKKRLVGLIGPGTFRAQIRFRWLDADGKVVRSTKRTTRTCRQPDLRPNLTVASVTAQRQPDDATLATYRVVTRNTGKGAAGPFAVTLGMGAVTPVRGLVESLARKGKGVTVLVGPACVAGSTIDITVDPEDAVAESDESDNTLSVACPLVA